ncbi:MAG: hypothetical protein LBK59_09435 [Bifidobacteriaceae bacterium]|nr:hypothetical protein [Bifidobacteriaceae bacterium]
MTVPTAASGFGAGRVEYAEPQSYRRELDVEGGEWGTPVWMAVASAQTSSIFRPWRAEPRHIERFVRTQVGDADADGGQAGCDGAPPPRPWRAGATRTSVRA